MNQAAVANILVIAGDTHFCYLMERYIQKAAHHIVLSSQGDNVFEVVRRENPSAIIIELEPMNLNGWNTLRALQANPSTSHIPVVLCSWMDEEMVSLDEGAHAFLQMPVLYQDFLNVLSDIGLRPCSSTGDE